MRISPYKIFTYTIVIIAYVVVVYKLTAYNNYANLWFHFTQNIPSHWFYLLICIALMPFNIITEAVKWKYAITNIEKISLQQAILATLKGQVGAIATPNKLGDFPTRATSLQPNNRTIGTIMGFVSSWTMSLVIIIIGLLSSTIFLSEYHIDSVNNQYLLLTTIICTVAIISIFSIPTISKRINIDKINIHKIKNSLLILSQVKIKQLITLTSLSTLRYFIFCLQLMFMFFFFDINITTYQAFISIPMIYLLSTITPTIVASEAATRSSYAILVLSPICSSAPTITLATSLLWALNCGIPIILGSFLFNKTEKYC